MFGVHEGLIGADGLFIYIFRHLHSTTILGKRDPYFNLNIYVIFTGTS